MGSSPADADGGTSVNGSASEWNEAGGETDMKGKRGGEKGCHQRQPISLQNRQYHQQHQIRTPTSKCKTARTTLSRDAAQRHVGWGEVQIGGTPTTDTYN